MATQTVLSEIKAVSKVIVAAIGLAATALVKCTDLVPVQYQGYATAFIALATIIGAYHAPYAPLGAARRSAAKLEGGTGAHSAPEAP